jgi:thymidylate synthase, flavin-dependent
MEATYVSHSGSDDFVCDVARVSFSKESKEFSKEQNEKLILYLARHNHISPFHHPVITFRMKAPVPIRTQCFKSKIGFAENEESRRYISSRPELYIPYEFRSKPDGSIKQGSGDTHPKSDYWLRRYIDKCEAAIDEYQDMIFDGIAPEQARFVLPQGCQVNWIWTGSLAAYARYYNLRADGHAQQESQILASKINQIMKDLYPISWKALTG